MKKHLKKFHPARPPQSEPLDERQVKNSAGGYAWAIDQWALLERFLILGSEGGSYYATEHKLTRENALNVIACINADGVRAVDTIVAISNSGRAPKNETAIFALALAASADNTATRQYALSQLPKVCRTSTHLFSFLEYVKGLRGWGRSLRRAIGEWYLAQSPRQLAYQVVKYRQRNGWTHRDALRLGHPKPRNSVQDVLFKWVTQREASTLSHDERPSDDALTMIWAFEQAQRAQNVEQLVQLITDYDLPREAIPTNYLKDPRVWDALLVRMPLMAMIRNLSNMTKCGLLAPGSDATREVVKRLRNANYLRKARIHPIAVLSALRVYAAKANPQLYDYLRWQMRGSKGRMKQSSEESWMPVPQIVDALDTAFELAFHNIKPARKRTMLALDVSGSMAWGYIAGLPGLMPRDASAAMAMVTARTEPEYMFTAFSHKMVPLDITAKMRLDKVVKAVSDLPFGATDCALPMQYALARLLPVDTFVIYTDSETWYGEQHPVQALRDYREKMGIAARLIVVGMVSNGFTIADPDDGGMLDVVGFDSAAPNVMADFARGAI